MNRLLLSCLLGVFLLPMAEAAPQQTFQNDSALTDPADIPRSVVNFINRGTIALYTGRPFETYDTLNVTNKAGGGVGASGTMRGTPGFWFNYFPSAGGDRRWAASFFNDNNAQVQARDGASTAILPRAMVGHSSLRIWATNIMANSGVSGLTQNRASLITGANGELDIWGGNTDLSRSGLEVLPVWNESVGSANDLQNVVFHPDLAVHDLAAIVGKFGPVPNALSSGSLWDGTQAQSYPAPPSGPATVGAFLLSDPQGDFYITADPRSVGIVELTNYVLLDFTTNSFIPYLTNQLFFTNEVFISAGYFATNAVFSTNVFSTNFGVAFGATNLVSVLTNRYSFTNLFFPTNSFDTTNVVFSTNSFVEGDVFADPSDPSFFRRIVREVRTPLTVYSNIVKGAFFGQAPPGFVISHGFSGGNGGRAIQATVSTLVSNAVTGLSDVASVAVQDVLASAAPADIGFLLPNVLTGTRPPVPATTRPVNYLVSRGGVFSGVIEGTNTFETLTNIIGVSENRLPPADFFTSSGIRETNDTGNIFYNALHPTLAADSISFDSVTNSVVEAGDYSAYQCFFDNIVEREINSSYAGVTNRTGRVTIRGNNLNLDRTRIRAEGLISITTPNLISSTNAVIDCESLSFDLDATNGTLRIKNLTKESVERMRGPITVWSAMWDNSVTTAFGKNYALTNGTATITRTAGTNTTTLTNLVLIPVPITNVYSVRYHTMMLDASELITTLPVTVYDLTTRSANVELNDDMSLAKSLFIGGKSFTLNSSVIVPGFLPTDPNGTVLSSGTALTEWRRANAPNLVYFTNNGSLSIPSEAHFGDDGPSPYSTFVNNGQIAAYSIHLNSTYFENRGQLVAGRLRTTSTFVYQSINDFGELVSFPTEMIMTNLDFMTLTLDPGPFVVLGFANLTWDDLSAVIVPQTVFTPGGSLDFRGGTGVLVDGESRSGSETSFNFKKLGLDSYDIVANGQINFTVTDSLYDTGPDAGNLIETETGFNLRIKPETGDLLGTTFSSLAPDVPEPRSFHTWAGEDRGVSAAGFSNNVAIGTLVFSLTSSNSNPPLFVFQGVGAHNAMYVDLLDVSALADFENEISIAPNLTIYFAAASLGFTPPDGTNGIPQTPEEYLDGKFGGRLRWVPGYAGANSSTTVTIDDQEVLVNSGLASKWVNNGIDPASVLHLAAVTVEISGNGEVTPIHDGQLLILGETNTIVAQPRQGATFLGWTGSFESSSLQLTFVMESDLVFTARFTFTPVAATYNGLFYQTDTNGIQLGQSGAITITTTKTGKYSGSAQVGAKRYPFTGTLDEGGAGAITIPKAWMSLEFQTGTDGITGTIGDGYWTANVTADRAVFNAKTNQAPFAGQYTLVFPGSGSITNTQLPFGDGYGTVTVDAGGRVRFSGSLADGTKVSQTATVSGEGQWPLYIPLYGGRGQLLSWQTFADTGDKDVGGAFNWIKQPSTAKFYPAGFQFETNAVGSKYNSSLVPLTGFADGVVTVSGDNLSAVLKNFVFINNLNKVANLGTNKFSLTLNKQGSFKGSAVNPTTGKAFKFDGAILQKQGYGSGYFLGPNRSGVVSLAPAL